MPGLSRRMFLCGPELSRLKELGPEARTLDAVAGFNTTQAGSAETGLSFRHFKFVFPVQQWNEGRSCRNETVFFNILADS
jgi:hypothetical protein